MPDSSANTKPTSTEATEAKVDQTLPPNFKNPTELVTIIANDGSKQAKFSVHKEFACYHSPVFKAAFESGFVEGQTQTYELENDEHVVRAMICWFYTQHFNSVQIAKKKPDNSESVTLVRLWVLADKLLIPKLQNMVVRKIEEINKTLGIASIAGLEYVWENTDSGSPLRLLHLHQCAIRGGHEWYVKAEDAHHFPQEMLLELVATLSSHKHNKSLTKECPLSADWSRYEVDESPQ